MKYAFRCNLCQIYFERNISIEKYGKVKVMCSNPFCGSTNVRRTYQYEPVPVIYKDEGFTKHIKPEEE